MNQEQLKRFVDNVNDKASKIPVLRSIAKLSPKAKIALGIGLFIFSQLPLTK